jgi:hypothetical protein
MYSVVLKEISFTAKVFCLHSVHFYVWWPVRRNTSGDGHQMQGGENEMDGDGSLIVNVSVNIGAL